LSNSYRKVANYILEHYDRAAFLTAAELGRKVGVSESAVVRFATIAGYGGYPELKGVLQDVVTHKLTTVDRMLGSAETLKSEVDVPFAIMGADMANIRLTARDLDRRSFHSALSLILNAHRILVIGLGSSYMLAMYLGDHLNRLRGKATTVGSTSQDVWENLIHLGKRDLAIGISFPRYTRATIEALAACRTFGCSVVALTDSVVSPAAKHANVILVSRHSIPAYTNSFCAPLSVINALLASVSMASKRGTARSFQRLEDLWKAHHVHFER
jgi:DNA-binding MurR/RpiR family transcriptional regulator